MGFRLSALELQCSRNAREVIASLRAETVAEEGRWLPSLFGRKANSTFVGNVHEASFAVRLNKASASSARPTYRASVISQGGYTCMRGDLSIPSGPVLVGVLLSVVMLLYSWSAWPLPVVIVLAFASSYRRERQALVAALEERIGCSKTAT